MTWTIAPIGRGDNLLYSQAGTPSLDLRFASTESLVDAVTGDNLVTFTRASSATYTDSQGVIRNAVTNLLLRSEDFSTTWTTLNAAVTTNQIAALNGTTTADLVVDDATNGVHYVLQTASVLAATTYTFSAYLKKGTARYGYLWISGGNPGWNDVLTVDLDNGASQVQAGSFGATSVTSLANGWYRVVVTKVTVLAGSPQLRIGVAQDLSTVSYAGTGTGIYLWGAQLEQSSTVGEYVPTGATINSAPRFDHNPVTGESLGLLVEEQRANLLLWSEEFNQAAWAKVLGAAVSGNSTTSPDGTLTADTLSKSTTANGVAVQTTPGAGVFTFSCYCKANTASSVWLGFTVNFAGRACAFDLISGVAGSVTNGPNGSTAGITGGLSSIMPMGNGWYRVALANVTLDQARSFHIGAGVAGSAIAESVYIWGAQLEAGAFPTSYIPTTTTAVTRSADVASITGAAFSSWYRQDEGTLFASATVPQPSGGNRRVVFATDGTGNNRVGILFNSSNNPQMLLSSGGTLFASQSVASVTAASIVSAAAGYKADDFGLSANGSTAATDTSGSVPTVIDRLSIGSSDGGDRIYGTIKRLTFWPIRLPNSTLQTITQ